MLTLFVAKLQGVFYCVPEHISLVA